MMVKKIEKWPFVVVICFLVALSACSSSTPVSGIPQVEREALVALYNSTDGDNWKNKTGWLGDVGTECGWFGIMCVYNRVYSINLPLNDLNGAIPKELGGVSELFHLKLNNNELMGSIPIELGELSHLNLLSLSFNQLVGEIPQELGQLDNLTVLTLSNNRLTGNIPVEFGQLVKLNSLSLSKNELTGSIPVELSKLTKLNLFGLSNNSLVGDVPPELVELKEVKQFYIYNNCVTLNFEDKGLKAYLEERDASVRRKRHGCADIMAAEK